MTNSRAAELLGAEYVNTVYAIGLLCTGIGFLSFSALRRLFKRERLRKAVICIVGIACIVSCCVFLTTNHIGLFALFAGIALVSCGHIGGCVYYHHAMTFLGNPYIGRSTGIGMSIAILLQILIHNLIVTKAVFIISIAISILLVLFIISASLRIGCLKTLFHIPQKIRPIKKLPEYLSPQLLLCHWFREQWTL